MQVEYMCHSGDDLLVVNAARASFGKESAWELVEVTGVDEHGEWWSNEKVLSNKDRRLINYLAREEHLLPFRHPTITLRCKAPIFVARQLGKHQAGMSWSEESRRYVDTPPEFFWPETWRARAENVKQGSSDEGIAVINVDAGNGTPQSFADAALRHAVFCYDSMLENGVAPELARTVLPQNMEVTWVWTGTLLSWMHMIAQRLDAHAQKETQDFAKMVLDIIHQLYPVSVEALRRHNKVAIVAELRELWSECLHELGMPDDCMLTQKLASLMKRIE